jgi:hypothetical protein
VVVTEEPNETNFPWIYVDCVCFIFQLIPGYRGYTVDSLRKLSILDDIMISADERHYFKGLARRRGIAFFF